MKKLNDLTSSISCRDRNVTSEAGRAMRGHGFCNSNKLGVTNISLGYSMHNI